MVSNLAKDLIHLRHLHEEFHAENLLRRIRIAVILTTETPSIAQGTTTSLVAKGRVNLAISTHTMIEDVTVVQITVTTTV